MVIDTYLLINLSRDKLQRLEMDTLWNDLVWLMVRQMDVVWVKLHHASRDQESVCIAPCECGIKWVCMYVCMYVCS